MEVQKLPYWQREIERRLAAWGCTERLVPSHDCMAMLSRAGWMCQLPVEEEVDSVSLEVVLFRDGECVQLGEISSYTELLEGVTAS